MSGEAAKERRKAERKAEREKFAKEHLDKALAKFGEMKDKELKKELQDRDLSTKGDTEDFIKRLKYNLEL